MGDNKILFGILCNETDDDHLIWVKACEDFADKTEYHLISFTGPFWLEEIKARPYDIFLAKPSGISSAFKQLYDERIHIMEGMGMKIYPSPQEIYIYENKRYFYSWAAAHQLPHPKTHVFYSSKEAIGFAKTAAYPFVAKTNIGASGSGVKILQSEEDALQYIQDCFSGKGAPKRWGPNKEKGMWIQRVLRYVLHPSEIRKKLTIYHRRKADSQKGFVIFQDYVPHEFEWRAVAIGDSYFAHKKLKMGEKASGSLLKKYDNPPVKLLDFTKSIMHKHGFYSQAIDILETTSGDYLINEMQCIFGQSDPYQMLVDGKPGRYRFINEEWVFEEGDFNTNASYDLRLKHILDLLKRV